MIGLLPAVWGDLLIVPERCDLKLEYRPGMVPAMTWHTRRFSDEEWEHVREQGFAPERVLDWGDPW